MLGWRIHSWQLANTQVNTQAPGPQPVPIDQGAFEKFHGRGEELMKQGDYSGAVLKFEQAVKLRPDDDEARMDLGKALEANGQKQKAFEELEVVCARNPDLSVCTQDLQKLKKDLKETAPLP
jgi:tetratricopeptide (TPR) repeat protein